MCFSIHCFSCWRWKGQPRPFELKLNPNFCVCSFKSTSSGFVCATRWILWSVSQHSFPSFKSSVLFYNDVIRRLRMRPDINISSQVYIKMWILWRTSACRDSDDLPQGADPLLHVGLRVGHEHVGAALSVDGRTCRRDDKFAQRQTSHWTLQSLKSFSSQETKNYNFNLFKVSFFTLL